MKIVKQMLKILGYILGGVICSALIVGVATLIVLTIAFIVEKLMSFQSIALIIQWIISIVFGSISVNDGSRNVYGNYRMV